MSVNSRRDGTTTKVFVGSLPMGATTADLQELFAPYGKIVECDIANRCGFLHLEDKDLAEKAIADLHNTNFLGGRISVERGRVKPPKSRRREREVTRTVGRDRVGPYSREDEYARMSRNGMEAVYSSTSGREYDRYDRAAPPRYSEYDIYADRKPVYGERERDYMDDRRAYPNGYDRPYDYSSARAYGEVRSAYDDRRMSAYADPIDDRRPPGTDHRPLDPPGSRPYERAPTSDMYSRRSESSSKPVSGYGDRSYAYGTSAMSSDPYASTYGTSSLGYSTSTAGYAPSGYGTGYDTGSSSAAVYSNGSGAYGSASGYTTSMTGYGTTAGTGYGSSASGYPAASGASAYSSTADYSTSGYADPYASSRAYETAYTSAPRSPGSGSRERRDLPPGTERRY